MPDNTPFAASLDPTAPKIADDEVAYSGDNAKVQLIQIGQVSGAEGSRTVTKWGDLSVLTGAVNEAAPALDTDPSGLNGRLQRIAQRLTSLIALLPSALTGNTLALRVGPSEIALTASVASGATVQAVGSNLAGISNWGIFVPSTFDGTQIQFQACDTLGGSYVGVYDITNTRVVMTVAASRFYDIPGELMAIQFLKIECVTVQAGSATDFVIVGKS